MSETYSSVIGMLAIFALIYFYNKWKDEKVIKKDTSIATPNTDIRISSFNSQYDPPKKSFHIFDVLIPIFKVINGFLYVILFLLALIGLGNLFGKK
jgi:hypothetical protein